MVTKEHIIEKIEHVPSFPPSAGRVIELIQKPDVDLSDVVKVIEFDPLMTSNILRLANSAYYRGVAKIETVRDAVLRLGLDTIFNMVVAIGFAPIGNRNVSRYDLTSGSFMEHSVAVAIGAVKLGRLLGLKVPSHLFTSALLHDIGKIVLGTYAGVDAKEILELARDEGIPFEVAETRILGINHAEVGAMLLKNWNMPPSIVNVVKYHHGETTAEDRLPTDLVHIANSFCLISGVGGTRDGINNAPSFEILSRYRVKEEIAAKLSEEIEEEMEDILPLFKTS